MFVFLFAPFLVLLASLAGAPSAATAVDAPQLDQRLRVADSLVASWVDAGRVPGAVLLVSRDGETVHETAHGSARLYEYRDGEYGASAAGESRPSALRRLGEPERITPSTVFDLASVTKVMATTMAVMLLVDRGQVDLDAPVHSYLPDFGGGGKEDITLRHILTHRSGLDQWLPIYYHASNTEEAYAYMRGLPLAWPIGQERHYSDLGFMLLGRVVEQVSGASLSAFLREHLYAPLGLGATGFRPTSTSGRRASAGTFAATSHGNPYEHRMVHDPGFGYRIEGDPDAWGRWRSYTLSGEVNDGNAFHAFGGVAGHAGLFSTARDLQVLLQLLLNRGEYRGRRYMSVEVVRVFLAPTGDGQALGWQIPNDTPAGSFSHTGFTGTFVLGVPEQGLAVVLLTNRQNGGVDPEGQYPDVEPLQRAVVDVLINGNGGPAP